jgi:site-specific recombinase XerC
MKEEEIMEGPNSAGLDGRAAATAVPEVVTHYRDYLEHERGLAPLTIGGYVSTAATFLERSCGGDPSAIGTLNTANVTDFVLAESARGLSPRTVNEVVVRLRSFLRFLYLRGLVVTPLAQAAPWLAGSRVKALPQGVDPEVGSQLVEATQADTVGGARDRAILSVLIRLGLRTCEVTRLELDDIDWRNGTVTIRGKGAACDELPLPNDVGRALGDYLSRRGPQRSCRAVFVSLRPNGGPMQTTAVRAVVRRACARAKIPEVALHRFRHGAGARLLELGATLPEIGQLLRHHHLQTTALYARVDLAALVGVAQPWPGARS